MKTVGITGGTGFVGRHLIPLLLKEGYKVIIFSRNTDKKDSDNNISYAHWDAERQQCDATALAQLDAIVHLAGAGVADKRWTPARKKEIVDSRVKATDFLVTQQKAHAPSCKTFISASATGFYGPDEAGKLPFTETSPVFHDFLGDTCAAWEASSSKAENTMRTVIFRFGIVLGKESGAFPEFVRPMSFGVMPILGSGRQVVSWIEVDDLARLLISGIEQDGMKGIYNAVSPHPVTHKELMRTIARIKGGIKIPAPVPAFILKIMLGELSTEILKSCTVSTQKTLDTGFKFNYPQLDGAVKAILGK